jgi:hypothetical protein
MDAVRQDDHSFTVSILESGRCFCQKKLPIHIGRVCACVRSPMAKLCFHRCFRRDRAQQLGDRLLYRKGHEGEVQAIE